MNHQQIPQLQDNVHLKFQTLNETKYEKETISFHVIKKKINL